VIRTAIPQFQDAQAEQLFFGQMMEILDEKIPRQGRSNPRFVKTSLQVSSQKPMHKKTGTQRVLLFVIADTA